MEILYRAGKLTDLKHENFINPEYIRAAKADVYPELRRDVLEELRLQELLTALGIARKLAIKGITSTTIEDGYESYVVTCEEYDHELRSKSSFRSALETLHKVGILGKSVGPIEKGKRGRRAKITTFDIPATVLVERIENILSKPDILKE